MVVVWQSGESSLAITLLQLLFETYRPKVSYIENHIVSLSSLFLLIIEEKIRDISIKFSTALHDLDMSNDIDFR
jgi:hypothetical protein